MRLYLDLIDKTSGREETFAFLDVKEWEMTYWRNGKYIDIRFYF